MEKLYSWSKNGMKMIINSKFKTFNEQTNCISSGNAIANTQYSNHIRPYTETECNGANFEKGHLQDYDLQFFGEGCALWYDIKEFVKSKTQNRGLMLYEIFYYKKDEYGELYKKVIGYIIEQDREYTTILTDFRNENKKMDALKLCKEIIQQSDEKIFGKKEC